MMNPAEFLRKLEPVVRPGGADRSARRGARPTESMSFEELIDDLNRPRPTGKPVELPDDVDLTEDQRTLLERAADRAQAGGSRRSIVILDGRTMILNVGERRIERELRSDTDDTRLIGDVDSAVITRPTTEAGRAPAAHLIRRLSNGAWPSLNDPDRGAA